MKTKTALANIIKQSTSEDNSTFAGEIIEQNPKIKTILNKDEPIALPTAISASPFLAATTEVTSSGNEVPTATIVKPTNKSLIPNLVAIKDALSTTKSPPKIIPANPIATKIKFNHHFLFGASSFLLFFIQLYDDHTILPNRPRRSRGKFLTDPYRYDTSFSPQDQRISCDCRTRS